MEALGILRNDSHQIRIQKDSSPCGIPCRGMNVSDPNQEFCGVQSVHQFVRRGGRTQPAKRGECLDESDGLAVRAVGRTHQTVLTSMKTPRGGNIQRLVHLQTNATQVGQGTVLRQPRQLLRDSILATPLSLKRLLKFILKLSNPPKLTQRLRLNQFLDFIAGLHGGFERQATIQLGQEGTCGLLEDPLKLLKAELSSGVQPLVAKVFAIRGRCLAQGNIQCHACKMTQNLGFATKERSRLIATLLHMRKHVHVKTSQHLLNTLRASLELQEVDGGHIVVLLESLLRQHQLRKDVVLLHTLLIRNSCQNDVLQVFVPHDSQSLEQCKQRNRLVIPRRRNDCHTLATCFRTRRHNQEVRLRTNRTIIGDGANSSLGLLIGLLLRLANLQGGSVLNQCLDTPGTLAYIRTLPCLLKVISQSLLGEHDLFGAPDDELASQFLTTLTGLEGFFGLQLGQPALTTAKHEWNPTQQNILQSLRQNIRTDGVLHQQLNTNLQEIGAFVQAADVGHNGLTGFICRSLLHDHIALASTPVGTHRASIFQLQGLRIRSFQQLGNLFRQEGVLGVQVVANQWKPRVTKQAGQKFPRDLHFLDD